MNNKKWFVYYHDGYFEDGGLGLLTFDSEKEALQKIEERLMEGESNLEDYILIYGEQLTLYPKKTIVKILPEPYI